MKSVVEVFDLRFFREQHQRAAAQLRNLRKKAFLGDSAEPVSPIEGPPCGPPTNVEEIHVTPAISLSVV